MSREKKETPKNEASKHDKFQEEFKGLPLEEKIKTLLKMEAVTLQETFSYGLNESVKAAERLGEVLSEFGRKIEAEFKKATCNNEAGASPGQGTDKQSRGAPQK